jgi:putative membrane protein insertion efficiency factor
MTNKDNRHLRQAIATSCRRRLFLIGVIFSISCLFSQKNNNRVFVDAAACQSCLFPTLHRLHHHQQQHYHHRRATAIMAVAAQQSGRRLEQLPVVSSLVGFFTLQRLQEQGMRSLKPVVVAVGILATQRLVSAALLSRAQEEEQEDATSDTMDENKENAKSKQQQKDKSKSNNNKPVVSQAMVATIGIYKNIISPLLPPACRFVPTCSQYGVQAIEEFGPSKGVVLTAWRLLRCSPVGGKGYDPPKWPPVSYTYSSY